MYKSLINICLQYEEICRVAEENVSDPNRRKRSLPTTGNAITSEGAEPAEKRKKSKKKSNQPETFIV